MQVSEAYKYAEDVITGKITACRWVKLACERFNRDFENPELYFDEEEAQLVLDFFGELKLWKGKEYKGKPFILAPHFIFIVCNIFGWKLKATGYRRFRTVYLELARKGAKALSIDTEVPTPSGWSTIGDISIGDNVFDEKGNVCRVISTTETFLNRTCYNVTFSDGTEIIADAGHLWETTAKYTFNGKRGPRRGRPQKKWVRTTDEILNTIEAEPYNGKTEWNHKICVADGLKLTDKDLPINPYVLGCWLGDGHSGGSRLTFHPKDAQIVREIIKEGERVGNWRRNTNSSALSVSIGVLDRKNMETCRRGHIKKGNTAPDGHCRLCNNMCERARRRGDPIPPYKMFSFHGYLNKLGLINNKHIPKKYLRGSYKQRLALLQGLMDTDGTIGTRGVCEFCSTKKQLAEDVLELVLSVGIKAVVRKSDAKLNGKKCGDCFKVCFKAFEDKPVFRLNRKLSRQCHPPIKKTRSFFRQIVAVEKVNSVPVKCISVDSKSHLFLVSRSFIPTHNSTFAGGVGAYMFTEDDEDGAECYAAAVKRDQAKIVWNNIRNLLKTSIFNEGVTFYKDSLFIEDSWSKCEPLSSDSKSMDGYDTHFASLDELHAHPTPDVHDLIDDSTGARSQSLILIITTAGFDQAGVCFQRREYLTQLLKGVIQDESFFGMIYTLDTNRDWPDLITEQEKATGKEGIVEDNWLNEDLWIKSMPGLCGVTESGKRFGIDENGYQIPGYMTKIEDVRKKALYASSQPAALNNFLTKRLNIWTSQYTRWIDLALWDSNYTSEVYCY